MNPQTPEQLQFSILLKDSKRVVYGVIGTYCRDEWTKDELYQEVCVRAWDAFKTFAGTCKFSSWIGNIARNAAIDRLRRQKSSKTILYDNILWEIADDQPDDEPMGLPLSIIDALSEPEKKTLQMRMDGMSFSEISEAMGEPVNRLIVRMHRIKHLLMKGTKRGRLSAPKRNAI